jgi:Tfp pilus assembly protein PilW
MTARTALQRCWACARPRARPGFSLVELIVGLTLLAFGLISVTAAGTIVTRQLGTARSEMDLWAGLQSVGDSLQARGFAGVSAGSQSIGGVDLSWTVDDAEPFINKVTLVGSTNGRFASADTLIIYIGDPNAP